MNRFSLLRNRVAQYRQDRFNSTQVYRVYLAVVKSSRKYCQEKCRIEIRKVDGRFGFRFQCPFCAAGMMLHLLPESEIIGGSYECCCPGQCGMTKRLAVDGGTKNGSEFTNQISNQCSCVIYEAIRIRVLQ